MPFPDQGLFSSAQATSTVVIVKYSIKQLQQVKVNNKKYFEALSFHGYDIDVDSTMFLVNPKYGKLDPPDEYMHSTRCIREWRRMGGNNKFKRKSLYLYLN
eukprot:11666060-Ditylum_brightwellii.AAC.1